MTTDNTPFDDYLTREQLRDALPNRPSLRTLDRWHARRIGPPRITIGRMVVYSISGVRQWLEAHTQGPVR
jgi:aromatic ring-cleaving dioxygenase